MNVPPEMTQITGFDALYGLEVLELSAQSARARVKVSDSLRQPYGLVHGGVYAAISESLASAATAVGVYERGQIATGMSNHTSFLRPITTGFVHATATCRHHGRTSWVWEVELTDDDGRLCALTRMTIAVRDAQ